MRLSTVICFFSCLFSALSLQAAVGDRYENQLIEQVEIIPVAGSVSNAAELLLTREGALFSQSTFDRDLKELARQFDRVEPEVELVDGKVFITLKLWARPVIRSICVTGNPRVRPKRIEKELDLKIDSPFDLQSFNEAFHRLKNFYVKEGFFEAELDYHLSRDEETNEIDITITIDEGRAGLIKQVCFYGVTPEEEADLLNIILTKPYRFYIGWLTKEGRYHDEMVQQDRYLVLNYLQNRGYVDAQVDISVEDAGERNRLVVTISVDKGAGYTFGTLSFSGNTLYSNEEVCCQFDHIPQGTPFSLEKVRETAEKITALYTSCGYVDAFVNYQPHLNRQTCSYDVHFTIEEGDQWRIGLIRICGNRFTHASVILHELLITPGDLFDLNRLRLTERRLYNMGYFKNVNVYTVESADPCGVEGRLRDVVIEVEETSTGSMGAFLGFSTDQKAFAGLNLTERNFNARGFCCLFGEGLSALRGGGEYLHLNATLGSKSHAYTLSWTKPHFLDTPWSVGFDLEQSETRYISDDYDIEAKGISVHATYACNPFLKAGVHWRLRNTEVTVDEDSLEKKNGTPTLKVQEIEESDGLISAMGISLIYDSTNHPLFPTCGFKSCFNAEVAGFGGDHSFFALSYLNSYYLPVFGGVLKLRADARFVDPIGSTTPDTIPLDERFFLGGDNELRGYRPYRLGPKFTDTDDPRGGISMQLCSVEFSYPIYPRVDLFVFEDAGFLTLNRWDTGLSGLSLGFGARLQVFEGSPPLTLGMGYPMKERDSTDRKNFFISFGNRF